MLYVATGTNEGTALWKLGVWKIKERWMGAGNVQYSMCVVTVFYVCCHGISRCAKIQVTGGEFCEKWKSSQVQMLRRHCNLQ
jgi:hypothetical protein